MPRNYDFVKIIPYNDFVVGDLDKYGKRHGFKVKRYVVKDCMYSLDGEQTSPFVIVYHIVLDAGHYTGHFKWFIKDKTYWNEEDVPETLDQETENKLLETKSYDVYSWILSIPKSWEK